MHFLGASTGDWPHLATASCHVCGVHAMYRYVVLLLQGTSLDHHIHLDYLPGYLVGNLAL